MSTSPLRPSLTQLQSRVVPRLRTIVPPGTPGLETASVSAGLEGAKEEFAIYDAFTADVKLRGGENLLPNFLRVNRSKFRAWLSTGIDIQWNKRFVKFEQKDGRITVFFADGSTAQGDFLIGADGVSSPGKLYRSLLCFVSYSLSLL